MGHSVIDAGRADKLRDDNTFCAVDDERTAVGHEREIAHIDFAFLKVARRLVVKSYGDSHRSRISSFTLFTFGYAVLGLALHSVIDKAENKIVGVVGDIRYISQYFLKTGFKEPSVRVFLHLNQVRHLHNFLNLTEAFAGVGAEFDVGNIYHWLTTPYPFICLSSAYAVTVHRNFKKALDFFSQ